MQAILRDLLSHNAADLECFLPPERIRERLDAWRDAGVTTLVCGTAQPEAIRLLAELVL